MAAICGILGECDTGAVKAMAMAMHHRGDASHVLTNAAYAVASSQPLQEEHICALDGHPLSPHGVALNSLQFHACCRNARSADSLDIQGAFAAAVLLDDGGWRLLRDGLGQCPLYYYQGPSFLLFASELKAILASGRVSKHLDLVSLDRYLTVRCVPGPETIIQGVRKVRPGHVLAYRDGAISETAFVDFDLAHGRQPRREASQSLERALRKAVIESTAHDLLFSSGLDSSVLAALKPRPRLSFVAVERAWQDETRLAKEAARRLDLPLHIQPGRRLTESTFSKAVKHLDEPIADPSVLPLWSVIESARERSQSFITGFGADELLGGYPRYHFLQKAQGAKRLIPAGLASGIQPALPPNAFIRRAGKYLSAIKDPLQSFLALIAVFDPGERNELYTEAMKAAVYDRGDSSEVFRRHFEHNDLTRSVLSLDLHVGLPDLLLAKCDRTAAAHGVVLEHPFLSEHVVRFALQTAPSMLFGVRGKSLLRSSMLGVLPGPTRLCRRRDFHAPHSGASAQLIDRIAAQVITPERVDATGLFRWHAVEQIVRSSTHNVYRQRQFWALLMFFAWYREVMEC